MDSFLESRLSEVCKSTNCASSFSVPTNLPQIYKRCVLNADNRHIKHSESDKKANSSSTVETKSNFRENILNPHSAEKPLTFHKRIYESPLEYLTIDYVTILEKLSSAKKINDKFRRMRILVEGDAVKNGGKDNKDNYLIVSQFSVICTSNNKIKFRVLSLEGSGAFSQVYKCRNINTLEIEALKVTINTNECRKQTEQEIRINDLLSTPNLSDNNHYIIPFLGSFDYYHHYIIRFPLLGPSLYKFLKKMNYRGIALPLIRSVTKQLVEALDYIHSRGYIHGDIKPENILLVSVEPFKIALIDLGSCSTLSSSYPKYAQSRLYRAPEVLLEGRYSNRIDIWSLGCVLGELYLGVPLFPGIHCLDQLRHIEQGIGALPASMLEESLLTKCYYSIYTVNGRTMYRLKNDTQYMVDNCVPELPNQNIKRHDFTIANVIDRILAVKYDETRSEEDRYKDYESRMSFVHVLSHMLELDPQTRYNTTQIMKHPFLTNASFTGSFSPPIVPSPECYIPLYDDLNPTPPSLPSRLIPQTSFIPPTITIMPSFLNQVPIQDPSVIYQYTPRYNSIAPIYVKNDSDCDSPPLYNSPMTYRDSFSSTFDPINQPSTPSRPRSMTVNYNNKKYDRGRSNSLQMDASHEYRMYLSNTHGVYPPAGPIAFPHLYTPPSSTAPVPAPAPAPVPAASYNEYIYTTASGPTTRRYSSLSISCTLPNNNNRNTPPTPFANIPFDYPQSHGDMTPVGFNALSGTSVGINTNHIRNASLRRSRAYTYTRA